MVEDSKKSNCDWPEMCKMKISLITYIEQLLTLLEILINIEHVSDRIWKKNIQIFKGNKYVRYWLIFV